VLEISMFPLSTPFLLTKPGDRMVMYLCARDIDVSSFYTFSIGFCFFDISVILMKKPDPRETQWKRLIEPLRWEVMVLAGCLVPVVSIILFSMERVNPFYKAKCDRISVSLGSGFFIKITEMSKKNAIVKSITFSLIS
jgi:hypothetical protein